MAGDHIVPPEGYAPAPDLLEDRVILVTGAGTGIGRAVALGCAAHGATVVLNGKLVHQLEAVYDEIEAGGGAQPAIVPVDLESATTEDCLAQAGSISDTFGRLDGLLHNAGILGTITPVSDYEAELYDKVMRVNLTSPFLLTQACLPCLDAAQDASVVFTSARVGRHGKAFWGAYGIAYAGIENLMQLLYDEHEQAGRIRFNSLDPGPVRTAMRRSAFPAEDPDSIRAPEEILPAYLYLLGPDSRDVNGRALCAQQTDEPA